MSADRIAPSSDYTSSSRESKLFYHRTTHPRAEMSDGKKNQEHGPGRHVPAVVDPSLNGIPDDPVVVNMAPKHDLNWLQATRQDEVPEGPSARSDRDMEERVADVWDAVEEMEGTEQMRRSRASD